MNIATQFAEHGFAVVPDVFNSDEINKIIECIDNADANHPAFRKTADLFAIRRFLKTIPEVETFVLKEGLTNLLEQLFGASYFIVKAIYFDKPVQSNWFVAWHQDLTISVDEKADIPGFGPWTVKPGQYAVQPPVTILENNFTVRIHLDDTTEQNGALKVIPGSHLKGIVPATTIDPNAGNAVTCTVPAGSIMLMRPLLFHASGRTTNQQRRRVIHIEFSNSQLPYPLKWAEN